jgi:hypothetical protein
VNVDQTAAPFEYSRRLITAADVGGDAKRAHSGIVPGGGAMKDAGGRLLHEEVWKYLFTSPVEKTGSAVEPEKGVRMNQRPESGAK